MQRLTKYPLLLGSIAKSTGKSPTRRHRAGALTPDWRLPDPAVPPIPLPAEDPTEKERIEQAEECCRRILNHVNEVVKDMENLLVGGGKG